MRESRERERRERESNGTDEYSRGALLRPLAGGGGAGPLLLPQGGQSKCFIEDLPASTLVVGEFAGSDIEATPTGEHQPRKDAAAQPLALSVVVKEPDGGILVDNIYPASGRVAFTSRIAGEHVVCFKTSSTRWFGAGSVKLELDLQTGADAMNDYDDIKQMEQLTELEVAVRRLNDRVVELRRGQSFFRNVRSSFATPASWPTPT